MFEVQIDLVVEAVAVAALFVLTYRFGAAVGAIRENTRMLRGIDIVQDHVLSHEVRALLCWCLGGIDEEELRFRVRHPEAARARAELRLLKGSKR